jgi:hypothetical protein
MEAIEYNGQKYDISNVNYNNLVNTILDCDDRSKSISSLRNNYKIRELRELVKYLNLEIKSSNKDVLCDLIVTAINDNGNTKVGLIRSEYLSNYNDTVTQQEQEIITLDDLSDITYLFSDDIVKQDTPVKVTVSTQPTSLTKRLTNCTTTAINNCMVWINSSHVDPDNVNLKFTAYNYVLDAVNHFRDNDPSRLLNDDIPNIYSVNTIEIVMEQKFEYLYGTKNGNKVIKIHNGKERKELHDDTKQASIPRWYKRLLSKKSKNREMNRKQTEFQINRISPPSRIENKQANDYSPEQLIFWNLYDRLPVVNESLSSSDPNKVTLTDITFCPYVHQIKVNGKFVISSLTVLDSENRRDRPVQNFTNKFKTGLLANWSLPFKWELFPSDWLYQEDDGTNEHLLQVALENDRLVLYKLSNSFTRKVDRGIKQLIGKHNSQVDNAVMYQERTKIADLGTIELVVSNDIQWVAKQPRYEYLADMLNKSGKISASEYDKYQRLSLISDKLSVDDRVLCTKQSIGQSLTVKGNYDPIIVVNGLTKHVKNDDNCKWLSKIFDVARLKMIKANCRELENKIQNTTFQQDINLADKRTRDFIKVMTTTFKSLIRTHMTLPDNQLQSLAVNMIEYCVMKLNQDRKTMVDMVHHLKISDALAYTDPITYDKRVNEFNKLVDKVRKYVKGKTTSYTEHKNDNGLITFGR